MTGFDRAFGHEDLNYVLTCLQRATLSRSEIQNAEFSRLFSRAGWLATFLSNSKSHKHRQKSLLFAALAKTMLPNDTSVEALCYTIFARTGTLPAAMHLSKLVNEKLEYIGPDLGTLSDEFFASYMDSYSDLGGGRILTEFQKSTANSLSKERCGIISAPTSAGKSFIIHEYVKSRLKNREVFIALFIVPTKALITQICAIYRKFMVREGIDMSIFSSVSDQMEVSSKSAILALTQERCIRLLSQPFAKELSFVFVDEIQSLENDGRGALLEYVLHEITTVAQKAKFFAAGPFIAMGADLGQNLFAQRCPSIYTEDSPVSQMVIQLTPVKDSKSLQVKVVDSSGPEQDFAFEFETDRSHYSRWQGSHTKAVCDAVDLFSTDSPSIVYARGPGTAQNWAKSYASGIDACDNLAIEMKDLIAYIKDSIHPQCSLVNCLLRRVSYHHAGLPDFVREEIEELFAQREIHVLFCTSTLLEGVNLPADKIFIVSARKADEDLKPFEFKNLIGRAGRLDQHLCGMVYCIQVPNDEESDWIEAFRKDIRKEIRPTIDERFISSFDKIRSLLFDGTPLLPEEDELKLRGTVTILRSRYLRGVELATNYLASKNLSEDQQNSLLAALSNSAQLLSIPPELALKNPYTDPFLQNQLYEQVKAEPRQWIIRRKAGFSTDLKNVFKQLDEIFHIIEEIKPNGNHSFYRSDLLTFAKLWLHGKPFNEIIIRALPSKLRTATNVETEDVDKAIKKAMDFITKDISFVTAKYFSVLSEIIRSVVAEKDLDDYAMTLALPMMLELGCSEPKTLALITAGIPRGAAIKIAPLVPDIEEDPVSWIMLNKSNHQLQRLPLIYKKILIRNGIWS